MSDTTQQEGATGQEKLLPPMICGECGLPTNICNMAVAAAMSSHLPEQEHGAIAEEYRSELKVWGAALEQEAYLRGYTAGQKDARTLAALKAKGGQK